MEDKKQKARDRAKEWYKNNKDRALAYQKAYRENNKELVADRKREYADKNKTKIKQYKAIWQKENQNKIRANRERNKERLRVLHSEYIKRREATDQSFKLANNLRKRLGAFLKGRIKEVSAVKDLGCSTAFLRSYLESKFSEGMNWDNYGRYGWHIDHIRPLASFDLTDSEQMKQACHYTNLQPLWWKDNIVKGKNTVGELNG